MNATPDSDAVTALDTVFELAVRLTDLMQQGLGERGLSASRAETLLLLSRSGPMMQRQLSEGLRCTPRYVTSLIDGLEAERLVRRDPHPTDRRASLITLTADGHAAAARMEAERDQAAQWFFGDLPPRTLGTFVRVARQVLERAGAPAADPPARSTPAPQEDP